MISEKRRRNLKKVLLRIGVSMASAFILFIIWVVMLPEYYGEYQDYGHYDYLTYNLDSSQFELLLCTGVFLIVLLFIWKLFRVRNRLIIAGSAVILMVSGTAFQLYRNSLFEIQEKLIEINLTGYEPFRENTLAKALDGESALSLRDNLPRLDGATALYPLYAAFARAVYPAGEYRAYGVPEEEISEEGDILYKVSDEDNTLHAVLNGGNTVICSRTAGAFDNLMDGSADVIFLMGVSEEQRQQAEECGLQLTLTPIGKEAFVFFVNRENAVSNLAAEHIRAIYAGQITNWRAVGGANRKILPYQRPENSGSQTMLKEIMQGTPVVEAPEKDIYNEMMGMYWAVAYKNHKNALGYSFRYYINDMIAENRIKFLAVDGVEPTPAHIASGVYPFAHDFYAVTAAREPVTDTERKRANNAKTLIEWILSPQGQGLVEKTGYVPLS